MIEKAKVNNYKMFANRVPRGAVVIDTVKTDKYPIGCVLIQYKQTGEYALLSGSSISTCNQAEAKAYCLSMEGSQTSGCTNLRRMREKAGMTQNKLAEVSGVNLRTVKSYDSGERDINGAACGTVKALAEAIKCQIGDLMEIPESEKTVWYVVVDDYTDYGAGCDVESFVDLEEAKGRADSIYNRLTGYEIRHRTGLYVLETTEKDSLEGDVAYKLI